MGGGDAHGLDLSGSSIMAFGAANESLRANRPPNCKRPSTNRVIRVVSENAGNPTSIPTTPEVVSRGLSGDMVGSVSSLSEIVIDAGRNAAGPTISRLPK